MNKLYIDYPRITFGDLLDYEYNSYWDERSESLYEETDSKLSRITNLGMILEQLLSGFDIRDAVDMGTGAGLVAIELARMDINTTAVDISEKMVAKGKELAAKYGVEVDFIQGDIQNPVFKNESFDLVICKDSLWNLKEPEKALRRWGDMLRPGGHMIIMDTNYYLHNTDPNYMERKEYMDFLNSVEGNETTEGLSDMDVFVFNEMAKELPLTKHFRPAWDIEILMKLGFTDLRIHSLDRSHYFVNDHGEVYDTPMSFVLEARKSGLNDSEVTMPHMMRDVSKFALRREVDKVSEVVIPIAKCLANRNCLKLFIALHSSDLSVKHASEILDISESLASKNLKMLKESGCVQSVRDGKETIYFLKDVSNSNKMIQDVILLLDNRDVRI